MKLINILGAWLLAFSGSIAITNNIYATNAIAETANAESVNQVESTKPSQAALLAAINSVKNIENYTEYSQLFGEELQSATKFYSDYEYLFQLVDDAEFLYENYDTVSAESIEIIIEAAEQAVIACGYKFGTVRQEYLANNSAQNSTNQNQTATPPAISNSATPVQSVAITTPTPTAASNTPSVQDTTSTVESSTIDSAVKVGVINDESADIEVPATGEVETNHKPLIFTLCAVAVACFLIGSMIILNRKKSYHPGRKF